MKIHKIEGYGFDSNIYLIIDKSIVMIDAGTGRNFNQVQNEFCNQDIILEDIDLLINTHCHYDHTGGNSKIIEASKCKLAAHKLAVGPIEKGDPDLTLAELFNEKIIPSNVDRVLLDGDTIELGDSSLEVLHTPGHTRGDISLYDSQERALFSGDTVFSNGIGRLDFPGSNPSEMINSLIKLSKIEIDKLYPGHGPTVIGDAEKCVKRGLDLLR